MPKKRRHEERVCRIVTRLAGEAAVHTEMAVPRASRRIDLVIRVGQPNPAWGPLGPVVAGRRVVIEHYSRTFPVRAAARSLVKGAHLADEHWRRPGEDPHPLLLFLVAGEPRQAIAALGLRAGVVPGMWRGRIGHLLDVALVNLRGLPREQSVLRLMAMPRTPREARDGITALLADPAVLQSDKDALLEEIMNETIPTTPTEHRSVVERLREQGREEGREAEKRGIAARLLAEGLSPAKVADLTGLELQEVRRLAR